jgi:type VI secretion system protein ImpG
MLRLELRALPGNSFNTLKLDHLRFFLSGENTTARTLYELLFNHVGQVVIRGEAGRGAAPLVFDKSALLPVGFGRDEGMLPYSPRSFPGYRLLTEYFVFPQKFLFFDIAGLERVSSSGFGERLEILLFLDRAIPDLEHRVNAESFRLGCCPIVNLFTQEADPIRLTQTKSRYHVIPDIRHPGAMEIYSIDAVRSTHLATHQTTEYEPFYSFKHASDAQRQRIYWSARREPSLEKDDSGTEMFLSLVDLDFDPMLPAAEVVSIRTTCTNRNLPNRLRASGGEHWGFQLDGHAPLERIVPLVLPTASSRLPIDQGRWRLISHLALNHLSITDGEDGAAALREMLMLYDFPTNKVGAQHIAGLLSVTARRCVAPILDGTAGGFCRGLDLTVEFDEDKYTGGGVFLFAAVLERFFGLYASMNSATRLTARSQQRQGQIKRWPFRVGDKTLI